MKADFEQFREFLVDLPKQLSLDRIRSRWTKYAFHFTDVRNAANILTDSRVRCRAELEQAGNFVDIACPSAIARTESEVKDFVRLYFRPRTPTQFRSEGIRPEDALWENSHCPVPVFFLFDLLNLLTRDDCLFSDGNLAKLGFDSLCSTAADLATFNFKKIYNDSSVSKEEKEDIIAHRNAEIVIPHGLDLSALKLIYCRSAAEKETFLYLLPDGIRELWAPKIAIASTATLFYRKWVFIESAVLSERSVILNFSPDPEIAGPFDFKVVRKAVDTRTRRVQGFFANEKTPIEFESDIWNYGIKAFLDDHLIYAGTYDGSDDIPF